MRAEDPDLWRDVEVREDLAHLLRLPWLGAVVELKPRSKSFDEGEEQKENGEREEKHRHACYKGDEELSQNENTQNYPYDESAIGPVEKIVKGR